MNRFKKYIRTKGYRLESDFPFLPYEGIECVVVHTDTCILSTYHNSYGWYYTRFNRDGSITLFDEYDKESEGEPLC